MWNIYKLTVLIFIIFSCIFSGISAVDIIVKNRRISKRNKLDRKTRREMLDEIDQKEWDKKLHKLYSTFPFWFIV